MKKVLALMLALIMCFSFAACDKNKAGNEGETAQNTEAAKEEVRATVDGFLSAFCKLDLKTAATFLTNPDDMANIADVDADAMKEQFRDVLAGVFEGEDVPEDAKPYLQKFLPLADVIADKYLSSISYKINSIDEKDGDFVVNVSMTTPGDSSVLMTPITEAFSDEALAAAAAAVLASGKVDASASAEEAIPFIIDELVKTIETNINATSLPTETQDDGKFVVVKSGDKWLIDYAKTEAME